MTSHAGKGRPTPKRNASQRRRTGPVAPPPRTRKEASKRTREQAALARVQAREGTARGDERYLVKRDAGPVRAMVRDLVDGRRNVGVLLLPLALLLVGAQISGNRRVLDLALTVWLAGVLAMIADIIVTSVHLRRRLRADFPEESRLIGHIGYGLLRSTVFRRFRMPAARVTPGRRRRS